MGYLQTRFQSVAQGVQPGIDIQELSRNCTKNQTEDHDKVAVRLEGHGKPQDQGKKTDGLKDDPADLPGHPGMYQQSQKTAGNHGGGVGYGSDH